MATSRGNKPEAIGRVFCETPTNNKSAGPNSKRPATLGEWMNSRRAPVKERANWKRQELLQRPPADSLNCAAGANKNKTILSAPGAKADETRQEGGDGRHDKLLEMERRAQYSNATRLMMKKPEPEPKTTTATLAKILFFCFVLVSLHCRRPRFAWAAFGCCQKSNCAIGSAGAADLRGSERL